ncbi:AAA family ATPase [Halomonas binhaiensis]|uniref:AAA family ATPase n=1 Tax=Halomonas binhaiensis TaxID=2562282 RepID=A0A5C1NJ68_9GAMM|nr:AAA family ATPase [Halomonas binhaiensis]QEM82418.1 AAA family ATPase [Halomonas binhaiensis]
MKINVVGTSGSGKTTLARRLAQALSLPHIEMDVLHWLPDWQEKPDEQFFAELASMLEASPGWVLDGNYDRSRPIKWREIDLVVWVDYGFWQTLFQVVSRAIKRAWSKQELWPGTGNRESFRQSFFSRDSIILWSIKTWRSNRARYLSAMHDEQYRHIRFVQLRSHSEAEAFIRSMAGNA